LDQNIHVGQELTSLTINYRHKLKRNNRQIELALNGPILPADALTQSLNTPECRRRPHLPALASYELMPYSKL